MRRRPRSLLVYLRCPTCRQEEVVESRALPDPFEDGWACAFCGREYPTRGNIVAVETRDGRIRRR